MARRLFFTRKEITREPSCGTTGTTGRPTSLQTRMQMSLVLSVLFAARTELVSSSSSTSTTSRHEERPLWGQQPRRRSRLRPGYAALQVAASPGTGSRLPGLPSGPRKKPRARKVCAAVASTNIFDQQVLLSFLLAWRDEEDDGRNGRRTNQFLLSRETPRRLSGISRVQIGEYGSQRICTGCFANNFLLNCDGGGKCSNMFASMGTSYGGHESCSWVALERRATHVENFLSPKLQHFLSFMFTFE